MRTTHVDAGERDSIVVVMGPGRRVARAVVAIAAEARRGRAGRSGVAPSGFGSFPPFAAAAAAWHSATEPTARRPSRWRRGPRAGAENTPEDTPERRRPAAAPGAGAGRGYLEAKRRRAALEEGVRRSVRAAEDALAVERGWIGEREKKEEEGDDVSGDATRASPGVRAVDPELERCARVGLLGAPNAGKSQLTNTLVGDKVTAVSRKTNTTRTHTMGVKTVGERQIVFVDAPGIVGAEHYRNAAHGRKVESAFGVASECDVLLFVVDAARQMERRDLRVLHLVQKTREAMRRFLYEDYLAERGEGEPSAVPEAVLVLNKVDKIPSERRNDLIKMVKDFQAGEHYAFSRVFPISAMTGAGTKALMEYLLERAPLREWEFDATTSTEMTNVQRALEIVREGVYNRVHAELPYGVDLVHVSWEDFRNGDVRIEQNILVDTANQRKIVVGKAGEVIGQIGINSRVVLEAAFKRKVHLILNVRLKKRRKNYGGAGASQMLSEEY